METTLDASWLSHQRSLIYFLAAILLLCLSNLWAMRRLGRDPHPARWPRLSVLVPVRNEQDNVGACLHSLLEQDYPDFEVLVLDDHSSDGTPVVLENLPDPNKHLTILSGATLPEGWLGKHWACHQLAQRATGELLLFTDADTRHQPHSLREAVAALLAEQADLLSAWPRQEVGSWAERLAVPVLCWSIHSFLPLALAYRLSRPAFTAANGQFMLFRRSVYREIGGHRAVRQDVVDDLALVRRAAKHRLRWRLLDGGEYIRCRMYHDLAGVWEGFSKNLFAAFDHRLLPFLLVWLWLALVHWEPLIVLLWAQAKLPLPAHSVGLALGAIAITLLLWGLTCWRFKLPPHIALLYPWSILLALAIALRSIFLTLRGQTTWRGRTLLRPRVRWW